MKRNKSKNKKINYTKDDDGLDTISDYSENKKRKVKKSQKKPKYKKRNWEEYLKNENLRDTINLKEQKIILIVMIM